MQFSMIRLITAVLSGAALCGCAPEQDTNAPAADWVFTNGRIYTVDEDQPWVDAVVVKDGNFVYVGDDAGAEAYAADDVEVTDLGGRMVIPGIVDGHTHPGLYGIEQFDAGFEATDREAFIAEVRAWAEENPGDGWVRGCCWPVIAYVDGSTGPDRSELDAIFPDRPVWITSSSWHSYWLNTRALEVLGIDEDSEDPRFPIAIYKRDDSGRLTGWIKEGAGWQLFTQVFEINEDIHGAAVQEFLQYLSERGVTTLYDGGNLDYSDAVYQLLSNLEKAGELPVRYEGTYMVSVPARRQHAVAEMKRMREAYGGERLQFNTIKLFMDGIHENRSSAMLEPFADDPAFESNTTLTADELRDWLLELHEEQFDLHIHAIGDLAVNAVLDGVEQAQAIVGEGFYPRVTMAHLQNIHPGDRGRFAELGVSANFTAWWHGIDSPDPAAAALGPERSHQSYPVRQLYDSGANVTFSSDDWRLDVLSPFLGMQVGHTRQYPDVMLAGGQDPDAFKGPASEKLPLEYMLKGFTINGAYQLRMEDRIGSIEIGKSADLVVLPEDLFEMSPKEIHSMMPDAVVMEGALVQGDLN
ncbi:MAG: amidohydrolase [Gammaproteobacteria bacterium]|nr:amidohydrolase [Gammaproteobacteria bacterium]